MLAAEVPSVQNGLLAKDLASVTWRLKRNVTWHDGKPFTADDVVFNYDYVSDPATAAVTSGSYREISRVDKLDSHTVKVVFKKPQPFWADAFCGNRGQVIPEARVRALHGREVARGPRQPQTRRHRGVSLRGLQARRHRARRAEPELPRAPIGPSSTRWR